jgi:transcription-repair coupling factor (superfamily II helicase)
MPMALRSLLQFAQDESGVSELAKLCEKAPQRAFISQSLRPYLLASLIDTDERRGALIVCSDDRLARDLASDLKAFLTPRQVRFYPARGVRYESHLAPPAHLVGLRVAALDALLAGDGAVVVASANALSEKVPDPKLRPRGFALERSELLDLDEALESLVACGYQRVEQVEERGEFALRGDILDIYPATEERAVRCELFDVEIERLSFFSTFTQRSLGEAERVEVAPAAELSPEHRELAEVASESPEERPDIAEILPVDSFTDLLSLVPDGALVVQANEEEIQPALSDHWKEVVTSFHDADAHSLYLSEDAVTAELEGRTNLKVSAISGDQEHVFRAQGADTAARSLKEAEPELEKLMRSGYRTVVAWSRRGEAERALYNLSRVTAQFLDGKPPTPGGVSFANASLHEGFLAPAFKLAVLPEHRLLRRRAPRQAGPHVARGSSRAAFSSLKAGDPVVHEDHGVGRFLGFDTKTVGGLTRDYLQLEYRDGDRVFVPSEQIDKVSRYVGADASDPALSKLGSKQWEQMKLRARRAAQALAGDLINLYAERRRRAGYAFPRESQWMTDFEHAFPYRETPDQLEVIEQVHADMEEARPMDRLLCGDVGYGKTEVALRAAFKAASDGKQVLFLAPTTVLAQQHYGTFSERMRDWPIVVEMVSRFRSQNEQRESIRRFQSGEVDVLIGTHRLLSRDVSPKELGLLIVDEEQRFGVKQKELLRQLRLKVDVLSLSATPIPRTLQMSLAGLRDISVIETPPEGRRPVHTYVGEYDEELVRQAIERERSRGGQVFFVHNWVETIDNAAEQVRAICPEASVYVAHGQMDDQALESVMLDFLRGKADVLVCTTIVEAGLDISAANTLIVERADRLGLAQLYQIRGRVGRSRERAYAYLFYPSAAALPRDAAQRLATLSDYTELGSGFKIAMRDLEIRGAGNLLGEEQSGHVAAVGFELYMSMLDEAVAELSGTASDEAPEPVRMDVLVDAYVPADYVPYEAAKIEIHRRVAAAREIAELVMLREELEDRFGKLPDPVENLISMQNARIKFAKAGAKVVTFRSGRLTVSPIELDSSGLKSLRSELAEAVYESGRSTVTVKVPDESQARFAAVVGASEAILKAATEPDARS